MSPEPPAGGSRQPDGLAGLFNTTGPANTEPAAPAPVVPQRAVPQPAVGREWAPPPSVPSAYRTQQVSPAPRPVPTAPLGAAASGAGTDNDYHQLRHTPVRVTGRPLLEKYLATLVHNDASDLHLGVDQPPWVRLRGELAPVAGENQFSEEDLRLLIEEALTPYAWEKFQTTNGVDLAYSMRERDGAALNNRFRVNVFVDHNGLGLVARAIPTVIPTCDELGLLPQIKELATLRKGLVVFCGPTGSGKSNSMAALVREINHTRRCRIFTFEDPIEFVHTNKRSFISHLEIGEHVQSFPDGMRQVKREDPDVILIGEMRDKETIEAAIHAANTGHLVISTLHTTSAPETINRIINEFSGDQQNQIRTTLASALRAVICQTLVPSRSHPKGRVVATEIMMATSAIRAQIDANDIRAIPGSMVDRGSGCITLDAHLVELMRAGWITRPVASEYASSPENLATQLGHVRKDF